MSVGERINQRIQGMRVLITGGGSGIGLATALQLHKLGARVAVLSNNAAEFTNLAAGMFSYEADVRSREQITTAIQSFADEVGGIDAVINAAGVSLWKPFLEMDDAFWDLIYDVNVKGTFLVNQAVAPFMMQQGEGFILNIASMSAVKSGMPEASAYASSKWAIVGFSRNLHLELKPHGIRVACFCPGSTRTPLHDQAQTPNREQMFVPDDIADSLIFMLAAPKNGHIQLLAQPAMFEEWR